MTPAILARSDSLRAPRDEKFARATLRFLSLTLAPDAATVWDAYIASCPPGRGAPVYSRFYAVPCPHCMAPAGKACRSPNGHAQIPHAARVAAKLKMPPEHDE